MAGKEKLGTLLRKMSERSKKKLTANKAVAQILLKSIRKNFREGGRPKKWKPSSRVGSGHKTLIGTSLLMKSIQSFANTKFARISTNKIYAPIHHYGGIIRPKNAKKLTIPIGLTKNERRRGMKARDFENTFVRKSKAGNLLIFQIQETKIRPLFLLVDKVKIPKRPFMMWQKQDVEDAKEIYANWLLKGTVK